MLLLFNSLLSLLYLSYPVQQLFKSCKLLPVMFSRIVLIGLFFIIYYLLFIIYYLLSSPFFLIFLPSNHSLGGGYSAKEYISCLSLMIGLAIFTIADKMSNANISFAGLLIILSALTFDGLSGGVLEIVLRSPVIVCFFLFLFSKYKIRKLFFFFEEGKKKLLVFVNFVKKEKKKINQSN